MIIKLINEEEQLSRIEALLEDSYGEKVDLRDEFDYLKEAKPKHWYLGIVENKAVGFIRHFPVGAEDLVELEVYAESQVVKNALLAHFVQEWDKDTKMAMRLCLQKKEKNFIPFLIDLSFELNKIYLEWHYTGISPIGKPNGAIIRFAQNTPAEVSIIQNILLDGFGLTSKKSLSENIKEEQIVVLIDENRLVGVCILSAHKIQREIIQITIASTHRRKGLGKLLLEQTILLYRKKTPRLHFKLRVKEGNIAAINLYKSIGFYQASLEYWLIRKK